MNFQGFFDSVPDALFFTLHGSRLFGVEGPESDWDVKGVRLPPARDLLLGDRKALAPLEHKLDNGEAAVHALQHFLDMLEKADTNAIDMLFAARSERGLLAVSAPGRRLLAELDPRRLVSRNLNGALSYARSQATKYSRKGDRLGLLEWLHAPLEAQPTLRTWEALDVASEGDFQRLQQELVRAGLPADDVGYEERSSSHGGTQRFLKVAEKQLDLNAKAAYNRDVLESSIRHYGERARAAQAQGGRDLKAWYHSLRVTNQALELHRTGRLEFPRPDAPLLRRVRAGDFDSDQLSEMLTDSLAAVASAEERSVLSERFDREYAQELMLGLYARTPWTPSPQPA